MEISRSRIAANYRAVRHAIGASAGIIGVVTADAYRHGAVEVARVLVGEGAEWLAVSSVEEGVTLRTAGIPGRILVMAGVMGWERQALREFRLTPVVHSLDELPFLQQEGPLDVHLKIDTGMDRLGTRASAAEIAAALAAAPLVRVEGLMSHFASATDFVSSQTEEQIAAFRKMAAELAVRGIHPPLMHFSSTNVSPARGPAPTAVFTVKPALTWKTRIVTVKDVPEGAKVGYGGSFTAPAPMRLAVLAAGYADGVPHRLSNKGKVIAGGKFAPIVGTVSMDLTTIDITSSPFLRPGDEVTLLGREGEVSLDAQQIAKTAGTISYNVLCGISARVKRFYTD